MPLFKVNLLIFGIGNIGSALITQIQKAADFHMKNHNLQLNISVIANSTLALFQKEGLSHQWQADFTAFSFPYQIEDIIKFTQSLSDDPVVVVDATASKNFVENYLIFFESGFHVVAANKNATTRSQKFYLELKEASKKNQVSFQYETNVGASLPILQTLFDLYQSHEKVTKIRGVFSGSLSYIFNRFGEEDLPFSKLVQDAELLGLTEPDSREDLSGMDVARKLLIVAREVGLQVSMEDVSVQTLFVPEFDSSMSLATFKTLQKFLDEPFDKAKKSQLPQHALRYVGELDVITQKLDVKLISVPKKSSLGQLKNSDNLFEIYTVSHGAQPLIIQGAGAGKEITARGVLSDILKTSTFIKTSSIRCKTYV